MSRQKFGWHSGALTCKDITIENDLTIEGDLTFGNASTDSLSVTGSFAQTYAGTDDGFTVVGTAAQTAGKDLARFSTVGSLSSTSNVVAIEQATGAGTSGAYGLYINCTGTNVEAIKVDAGTCTFDEVINCNGGVDVGTFASPISAVKDDPLVMISGDTLTDQTSGEVKGLWVRSKVSKDQPATSILGIEAQCRVNGAASAAATLGAGQFTGIWAYWEQSGTTALNTGALASAASCTVESAATLTIDSGAILAGVVVDSSVNASATNNGKFDAIYIKKAGGALDFVTGIEFTDCVSGQIFAFADDQTICSDDNQAILVDIHGTANAGFIKVLVGSSTKYIALYDTKTS